MRPIDADKLHDVLCEHIKHNEEQGFSATEARLLLHMVDYTPTIKAYTIEDLRDAYRDGQDNECSYHWGIRKAEPWYMVDEVEE